MRKNRFTIDELMEELREQGVTRIEDVKYAVLENSGQLTVFPWTAQQPPTAEQLGLGLEDDVTLPMVIINDGRVIHRNLTDQPLGLGSIQQHFFTVLLRSCSPQPQKVPI